MAEDAGFRHSPVSQQANSSFVVILYQFRSEQSGWTSTFGEVCFLMFFRAVGVCTFNSQFSWLDFVEFYTELVVILATLKSHQL